MANIPQDLMRCSLMHFESGVPIDDLDIRPEHRRRLARVSHVYWIWKKNPFLDVFPMFKQLVKGKYADVQCEWRAAQKDKWLFDFVIEHVAPPSRRMSEERVRAAGYHLMDMGMQTDNGRDIKEGARIIMDLDRLGEPEDQRADMSKVAFLPTVVVTNIREIDDTREEVSDEETKRIMAKYNAYVDGKSKAVEEKVSVMEAKGSGESKVESYEQNRE